MLYLALLTFFGMSGDVKSTEIEEGTTETQSEEQVAESIQDEARSFNSIIR